MAYLIQGLFFQVFEGVDVGYDPNQGPRAMVVTAEGQFMFAGAIWEKDGKLVGKIKDGFGLSDICDISVGDNGIRFTKKYDHKETLIHYEFGIKDGNSWVGTYEGSEAGRGVGRCILTEVPENFFESDPIVELLGIKQETSAPAGS